MLVTVPGVRPNPGRGVAMVKGGPPMVSPFESSAASKANPYRYWFSPVN